MVLLGSELPNKAITFYCESTDGSNILRTTIELYEAWNEPEKAKEWQAKPSQIEAREQRHCTRQVTFFMS
jgi:hypothetical protein